MKLRFVTTWTFQFLHDSHNSRTTYAGRVILVADAAGNAGEAAAGDVAEDGVVAISAVIVAAAVRPTIREAVIAAGPVAVPDKIEHFS